jgi:hypothetical protein
MRMRRPGQLAAIGALPGIGAVSRIALASAMSTHKSTT